MLLGVVCIYLLLGSEAVRYEYPAACQGDQHHPGQDHHRWNAARRAIGLPPVEFDSNQKDYIQQFFHKSHSSVVYNVSNRPIRYITNWKAANMNVRANLYRGERVSKGYRREEASANHTLDVRYRDAITRSLVQRFGFTDIFDIPAFTFVREPYDRFVSAMVEVYYRLHRKRSMTLQDGHVTASIIEEDFIKLLDFGQAMRTAWMHIFPMAGILHAGAPVIVGLLESFSDGWTEVNQYYSVKLKFLNLTSHASSSDVLGVRMALSTLFRHDSRYLKAICTLLEIDYICFPYYSKSPMASECRMLLNA